MNQRQRSFPKQAFAIARLLIVLSMIISPLMPSRQQNVAQGDTLLTALAAAIAPNTATAATGVVTIVPIVPITNTTAIDSGLTGYTGLCTFLNCFINNQARVVDNNLTNFAQIGTLISILGGGQIGVNLGGTYPAGTRIGFLVDPNAGLAGFVWSHSVAPALAAVGDFSGALSSSL